MLRKNQAGVGIWDSTSPRRIGEEFWRTEEPLAIVGLLTEAMVERLHARHEAMEPRTTCAVGIATDAVSRLGSARPGYGRETKPTTMPATDTVAVRIPRPPAGDVCDDKEG